MVQKGKQFWERIKNNRAAINLSSLLTGNIIAVLIPVLISPILTRLFTESDFGLLTIFNSILAISLSFATGRLDFAIIEAKNKSIASHLFFLSITIASVASIIALVVGFAIFSIFKGFESNIPLGLVVIIPVMILVSAITQSFRYVLNRSDNYYELSIIKVLRSLGTGGLQLTGGYIAPGSLILIGGKVIGDIGALFFSLWFVVKNKLLDIKLKRYKFRYTLTKYSKYYKINALHAFISTLSANLLPLIFAVLFTIQETGYYGLSYRVSILPITIISQALFQFFSREFAKKIEKEKSAKKMFSRMIKTLLLISLVPFVLLIFFGPQLFGIVFGENWTESGKYAQILAPYM
ncbi:MAG: oligosaccharide flippase family protein, partial [Acidimicrobiia bacterium]|nr:oligosaccharide flippase family protein [Acidimicrobiia bacterium]